MKVALILLSALAGVLALGLVAVIVGAGGSLNGESGDDRPDAVNEPLPPESDPPPAPEEDPTETAGIGEAVRSGGIKLTVVTATEAPSLTYTDDNGDERTRKARQGGSYVSVKTRITNDTSRGIDLTCSFPVDAKAVDGSGREFDPYDELDTVPGNPECNDMLQPGFKDTMTWVFFVPDPDEISTFKFSDVTDFDTENAPGEVALAS